MTIKLDCLLPEGGDMGVLTEPVVVKAWAASAGRPGAIRERFGVENRFVAQLRRLADAAYLPPARRFRLPRPAVIGASARHG